MENKTCGECRHFVVSEDHGGCCTFICDAMCDDDRACYKFQKPTNGDRIRQGGDDALIDFADGIRRRMCHYCAFAKDKSCVDKTGDCWEGVRAWLNAPADCVKQNCENDTQAYLCEADYTESEGNDG